MKEIRISFEAVEADDTIGLSQIRVVPAVELRYANVPLLALRAQSEAEKFWEVVVSMGAFDDEKNGPP